MSGDNFPGVGDTSSRPSHHSFYFRWFVLTVFRVPRHIPRYPPVPPTPPCQRPSTATSSAPTGTASRTSPSSATPSALTSNGALLVGSSRSPICAPSSQLVQSRLFLFQRGISFRTASSFVWLRRRLDAFAPVLHICERGACHMSQRVAA